MAVHIRLKRIGRRKRPFYRIVVMDSHTRRDGREIEKLGWYDPLKNDEQYSYDETRAIYWLGEGAAPSNRVNYIFKESGLALKWHNLKSGKSEEEIAEEIANWAASKEANKELMAEKAKEIATEKKAEENIETETDIEAEVPGETTETPAEEQVEES